jgi:tripartite-type tricarboxylate transporter receptor subunit TctC
VSGKLQSAVARILSRPEVKARLNTLGFEAIGSNADYFTKYIADEMAKSKQIIDDAKIRVE